jgi:hypothetical protein
VGLEGFAGFEEGFEAGEDAGPAVSGVGVAGVVGGPLVVGDGDFGGFGFGRELDGDAGELGGGTDGEGVTEDGWGGGLEDFAVDVVDWFAVGAGAGPADGAMGLEIGVEVGAKDEAVGFGGDEALPDFVRRCGDVEDEVQGSLVGHWIPFGSCAGGEVLRGRRE